MPDIDALVISVAIVTIYNALTIGGANLLQERIARNGSSRYVEISLEQ